MRMVPRTPRREMAFLLVFVFVLFLVLVCVVCVVCWCGCGRWCCCAGGFINGLRWPTQTRCQRNTHVTRHTHTKTHCAQQPRTLRNNAAHSTHTPLNATTHTHLPQPRHALRRLPPGHQPPQAEPEEVEEPHPRRRGAPRRPPPPEGPGAAQRAVGVVEGEGGEEEQQEAADCQVPVPRAQAFWLLFFACRLFVCCSMWLVDLNRVLSALLSSLLCSSSTNPRISMVLPHSTPPLPRPPSPLTPPLPPQHLSSNSSPRVDDADDLEDDEEQQVDREGKGGRPQQLYCVCMHAMASVRELRFGGWSLVVVLFLQANDRAITRRAITRRRVSSRASNARRAKRFRMLALLLRSPPLLHGSCIESL